MSVSVIAAQPQARGDGWFARELLGQSTSTTTQALALTTDATVITSTVTGTTGTATGFERNVFTLSTASAVEGQRKVVLMASTGEVKISMTGTATGRLVLSDPDDILHLRYLSGKWRVIESSATVATAT